MNTLKKIIYIISPILVFLLIFVIMDLAIKAFEIPKYIMVSPFVAFEWMFKHFDVMIPHITKTGWQYLTGYPLGALIGITFALIFTNNKFMNKAISPYLTLIICTPQLIMVPLLKMWLGFGAIVCVIASALSCFAIIMTNTMTGVSMVSPERIELMQSLKASKLQTFFMVIFPSALPSVFTGLKLGCIFALSGIIGAEMTGDTAGIGAMILTSSELVKLPQLFAYIFFLMIFGYVIYSVITAIEGVVVKES